MIYYWINELINYLLYNSINDMIYDLINKKYDLINDLINATMNVLRVLRTEQIISS